MGGVLEFESVPVSQRFKNHVGFDQAQQPEARPVTHTSYRKSCEKLLEMCEN